MSDMHAYHSVLMSERFGKWLGGESYRHVMIPGVMLLPLSPAKDQTVSDKDQNKAIYEYMHSHMMKRGAGGSGDVNWFEKAEWEKGYKWQQNTIFFFATDSKEFGLTPGHAYSVFAVERLTFSGCATSTNNGFFYAVQGRNPWRAGDAKGGKLADNSAIWTDCQKIEKEEWTGEDPKTAKKKNVPYKPISLGVDGIFWLEMSEWRSITVQLDSIQLPPRDKIFLDVSQVLSTQMRQLTKGACQCLANQTVPGPDPSWWLSKNFKQSDTDKGLPGMGSKWYALKTPGELTIPNYAGKYRATEVVVGAAPENLQSTLQQDKKFGQKIWGAPGTYLQTPYV